MVISQTPVRICLGGGGTDLASYYSKHEGFLVSAAINRYVLIVINKKFEGNISLKYSKTETVKNIDEIKHPLIRESLKLLNFDSLVEITSISDVPPNSGLGTSGSFTVGLLNALHSYRGETLSARELAEEACTIEIDMLRRPVGKQDQYIAALGGLTCLEIQKDGKILVNPLRISTDTLQELEKNIVLFYTGIRRHSSAILQYQKRAAERNDKTIINDLHRIKEIGKEIKEVLENGNLRRFGELLDIHWQTKRRLSSKVSSDWIDKCHNMALKRGALGGKIVGAGGGGFFMFYCGDDKRELIETMKEFGLKEMSFKFDFEGSKVLVNFQKLACTKSIIH